MIVSSNEARIVDDSPGIAVEERDVNLVAVGMAGEHQVPRVADEQVLGVRVVVEKNSGSLAGEAGEGLIGLDFEGPEVANAD